MLERKANIWFLLGCAPKSSSGDVGEFEIIDDHRTGKIVSLTGKLDKCGVISPRRDTQLN